MKVTFVVLRLCIVTPIYFYLLYKILQAVEASELMWFLFWAYVPASIVAQIIQDALLKVEKEK